MQHPPRNSARRDGLGHTAGTAAMAGRRSRRRGKGESLFASTLVIHKQEKKGQGYSSRKKKKEKQLLPSEK